MLRKKVITYILIAVMACGLLAGCGSKSSDTKNDVKQSGESSKSKQSEKTDKSTTSEEVTVIRFGIHVANPAEQENVTYRIVEEFNKKYDGQYRVDFIAADTETHSKNMKLAATDGSLPEIFWVDASEAPEYAENGLLLDLSDYLASSSNVDTALNGMEDAFNNGTIQYGLPYQCNVEGIFYNKAVFDKAGVSYPDNKTTYDEFIQMVKDLKASGTIPIVIGSKNSGFAMWEFNIFLSRYGWEDMYESIAAGEAKYNNEALLASFEKIAGLTEAGAFPDNVATLEYFDAKQIFNNGEAAMFGSGQWDCNEFDKYIGENIGFFWGPIFEDSSAKQEVAMKVPSAPLVCSASVAKDSKKLEALYAFLDFYYGEEAAVISYEGSIFPATNYSNVAASASQYAMNAVIEALSTGWSSPAAAPDQTLSSAVQQQLYDSIFGVIQGNYTPEEALNKMDAVAGY